MKREGWFINSSLSRSEAMTALEGQPQTTNNKTTTLYVLYALQGVNHITLSPIWGLTRYGIGVMGLRPGLRAKSPARGGDVAPNLPALIGVTPAFLRWGGGQQSNFPLSTCPSQSSEDKLN